MKDKKICNVIYDNLFAYDTTTRDELAVPQQQSYVMKMNFERTFERQRNIH